MLSFHCDGCATLTYRPFQSAFEEVSSAYKPKKVCFDWTGCRLDGQLTSLTKRERSGWMGAFMWRLTHLYQSETDSLCSVCLCVCVQGCGIQECVSVGVCSFILSQQCHMWPWLHILKGSKRNNSLKNENDPIIYSPSSHPRCIWLSSFSQTQL